MFGLLISRLYLFLVFFFHGEKEVRVALAVLGVIIVLALVLGFPSTAGGGAELKTNITFTETTTITATTPEVLDTETPATTTTHPPVETGWIYVALLDPHGKAIGRQRTLFSFIAPGGEELKYISYDVKYPKPYTVEIVYDGSVVYSRSYSSGRHSEKIDVESILPKKSGLLAVKVLLSDREGFVPALMAYISWKDDKLKPEDFSKTVLGVAEAKAPVIGKGEIGFSFIGFSELRAVPLSDSIMLEGKYKKVWLISNPSEPAKPKLDYTLDLILHVKLDRELSKNEAIYVTWQVRAMSAKPFVYPIDGKYLAPYGENEAYVKIKIPIRYIHNAEANEVRVTINVFVVETQGNKMITKEHVTTISGKFTSTNVSIVR